jgi:DNA-binding NarL/FixJ family response regulator
LPDDLRWLGERGSGEVSGGVVPGSGGVCPGALGQVDERDQDQRLFNESDCDDQALVRGGLRMMAEAHPDVVLMDIRMPVLDGIEATRRLLGAGAPAPRVLILTTFDEDEYVYAGLRAGASGFLLKSAPPADLVRAIEIVHDGQALLAPGLTQRLIEDYLRRPVVPESSFPELTHRETEIRQEIAGGRSNDEIAEALVISPAT